MTLNRLDKELIDKIQNDINENKLLEKLYADYRIQELIEFNEHNLMDKIKDNPFISEQFRLLYLKEAQNLKRIEIIYDTTLGKQYDHYKYNCEKTLSKTEIEKYYLPMDESINKLKDLLSKQQLRTDFFESVWKTLDKQAWVLKMFQQEMKGI